jgi:hypothetical protein
LASNIKLVKQMRENEVAKIIAARRIFKNLQSWLKVSNYTLTYLKRKKLEGTITKG